MGFVSVVARVFGKNREMRLTGVMGFHVTSESCDDGPATCMLLSESLIVEGLEEFRAFQKRWLKEKYGYEVPEATKEEWETQK